MGLVALPSSFASWTYHVFANDEKRDLHHLWISVIARPAVSIQSGGVGVRPARLTEVNMNSVILSRACRVVLGLGILLVAACAAPPKSAQAVHPVETTTVASALYQQYQAWQGTAYRYGGMSKAGVDCSGFVYLTYRDQLGMQLPRTTLHQSRIGQAVSPQQLQAGDLVFFLTGPNTRHVGIALDKHRFVHASKSKGVVVSRLANDYWQQTFWQARRVY